MASVSFATWSVTVSAQRCTSHPEIANFGRKGTGDKIKPGMTLAIEPMVNLGGYKTKILGDGWTCITADGSPSAHFEHTVLTTESGPEILTVPRPVSAQVSH